MNEDNLKSEIEDSSSWGVKGILEYFDGWTAVFKLDGHDVEAARAPGEATAREIVEGEQGHATTLEAGDGVDRPAELPPHARLDLDENDGGAVARDDVQFATPQAIAAGNNCVPATFELATREILADFTERLPGTRHQPHSQQCPRQIITITAETAKSAVRDLCDLRG